MTIYKLKVGDEVILGKHTDGGNWSPDMDRYVGKTAKLTAKWSTVDTSGNPDWYVDIDGGEFYWREINMIQVGEVKTPTSTDPSVPAINDHSCPSCGNDRCSKSERTCWKCGGKL